MQQSKDVLRASWLNCFIQGEAHYTTPQERLGICIPHPYFQVVIVSIQPTEEEMQCIFASFDEKKWTLADFETLQKETVIISNHGFSEDELPSQLRKVGNALDAIDSNLVFGVGVLAVKEDRVPPSYRCARRALTEQYFGRSQRVCVFNPKIKYTGTDETMSQIITKLNGMTTIMRDQPLEEVSLAIDQIILQIKEMTPYLNTMRSIMLLAAMVLSKPA